MFGIYMSSQTEQLGALIQQKEQYSQVGGWMAKQMGKCFL